MAAMAEFKLPHEIVNVHGGACALGHPIGATGAVITVKAIYELLETVTDRCEDVANIIEGIVLENS